MNSQDACPKRSDLAVIAADEGGVVTVTNPVTGRVFVLNDVGRRIIELCDGSASVSDIIAKLRSEFHGVEATKVGADIDDFLNACADAQLIEISPK